MIYVLLEYPLEEHHLVNLLIGSHIPQALSNDPIIMVSLPVEMNVFHGPSKFLVLYGCQPLQIKKHSSKDMFPAIGRYSVLNVSFGEWKSNYAESIDIFIIISSKVHKQAPQADVRLLSIFVIRLFVKQWAGVIFQGDTRPGEDVIIQNEDELGFQFWYDQLSKFLGKEAGCANGFKSSFIQY